MEDICSPFNWDCNYFQEEGQGIEDLKHTLLYTFELETTIAYAHEEIARKGNEVLHFKCLLTRTVKERDEAQLKCQSLVLENLILQQKIQDFEANAAASSNYLEDDDDFAGAQGTDGVPPPPQPEVIDNVVLKKGLPENGKFLQAVVEAGPLLQTLLLAGPLPQWQHPPPQLNTIEIPPVTIPSTSTTTAAATPRMLLHQDSCVSAIISGGGGGMISRKRGLEESCEGHNYDSTTPATTNTKNQKVGHQSPLTI